ncbi:hypothetical protein [Sphingomonas adhaesiva]|uniref:hypothetical protein n=1 Tax=Sphingomonas adhaesiva TaxID=28212 RepID=UPI002FF46C5A
MRERLRALTPEHYRDLAARSRCLVRDQRMLAADLRQEALVRALEGRRKCRQSWDVAAFLKGVMRSIIGDERRDEAEGRVPVLRDDLDDPVLDDLLPVEQLALDAIDYRRTIVSIHEALRSDPQLMALANAILAGKRGEALQRQFQVDADGLAALRRKLKRKLYRATEGRSRP